MPQDLASHEFWGEQADPCRLQRNLQGQIFCVILIELCMQVLMKLAEARNSKPLPKFRTRYGISTLCCCSVPVGILRLLLGISDCLKL